MTEAQKNGQALVSRRMARACAEILAEHLADERARQMVYKFSWASVKIEREKRKPKGKK